VLLHDTGQLGTSRPHTGYIDPRLESADGISASLGLRQVTLVFSEPVRAPGGGALDASSFEVRVTGEGKPPSVAQVDASQNPRVVLTFGVPIPLQEWTTVIARVENLQGTPIYDAGDLGPGVGEPDRVDIAFLPGDIDQDGVVTEREDRLAWQHLLAGIALPSRGLKADSLDTDRNGRIQPVDLLRFRRVRAGVPPATRRWLGTSLHHPQP
jgi:hypothetical protein